MRKLCLAAFALAFAAILSTSTAAQQRARVVFDRGSNRTTLTGTLNGYKDHKSFVIRVRRGQRLTTESIGRNHVTVDIRAPKGSTYEPDMGLDCHDRHDVNPTAAGDYVITVTECLKADRWRGTFKVRVIVR